MKIQTNIIQKLGLTDTESIHLDNLPKFQWKGLLKLSRIARRNKVCKILQKRDNTNIQHENI